MYAATMGKGRTAYINVLVLCGLCYSHCADISEAKALREYVFANYSGEFRPLFNQSKQIDISTKFFLTGIEFDGVRQEFECSGLFQFIWKDEFMSWNSSDFGGIEQFSFAGQLKPWFPAIILTNTRARRDVFSESTQYMVVYNNGTIVWIAAAVMKSPCPLLVERFPFDTQTCSMFLLPIHYSSDEVNLLTASDVVTLDLYVQSGQWDIVETALASIKQSSMSKWKITFGFQRRSLYYVLNVIVQVLVLAILNMAVFAIPVESGEKMSYSITIVLALVVYMSYVSGLLPESSIGLSMLTGYLTTVTASSAINVILTIGIIRLYNRSNTIPVPTLWRKIVKSVGKVRNAKVAIKNDDTRNPPPTWQDVAITLDSLCLRIFSSVFVIFTISFYIVLYNYTNIA